MCSKQLVLIAFLALCVLSAITPQALRAQTTNWTGANGANPNDATDPLNWDAGVPIAGSQMNFLGSSGTQVSSITVPTDMDMLYIFFGNLATFPTSPYGDGGVGRTFTGAGKITIDANGNIDSGAATSPVTFSNAELDLTRAASVFSTASNMIINTPVFNMGVGPGSGTPRIQSASGVDANNVPFSSNIVVNPAVDFSLSGNNRRFLVAPAAGTTISLNGGITTGTAGLMRQLLIGNTSGTTLQGTVILGSYTGANPQWNQAIFVGDSNLRISTNDGLAASGTSADNAYTQIGGFTLQGALQLTNGLTTNEYIYLDQRAITTDINNNSFVTSQLTNTTGSGTTTVANAIELENGGHFTAGWSNWAIGANGTNPGDLLKISAPIYTASGEDINADGPASLYFQGAGKGVASGNISEQIYTTLGTLNVINVVKADAGTWTLSGTNTYSGTTTITGGTLLVNGTHTGGAAYSVMSGGTLGGNGTITTVSNAGVSVAAGGFLAPGAATGTLHMNLGSGTLDISGAVGATASHSLLFTLATTSTSSEVQLTNAATALNIGTGVLNFDDFLFSNIAGFGAGTYTLFDSSTAILGTLGGSLTGTIGGLSATLSMADSNHDIVLTVSSGTLLGDVNGDHVVNGLDIAVVASHWLLTGATLGQGDANGDGTVNGLDIALIASHWLNTSGPGAGSGEGGTGAAAVPEPSTFALAAFALAGLLGARRRRSS